MSLYEGNILLSIQEAELIADYLVLANTLAKNLKLETSKLQKIREKLNNCITDLNETDNDE